MYGVGRRVAGCIVRSEIHIAQTKEVLLVKIIGLGKKKKGGKRKKRYIYCLVSQRRAWLVRNEEGGHGPKKVLGMRECILDRKAGLGRLTCMNLSQRSLPRALRCTSGWWCIIIRPIWRRMNEREAYVSQKTLVLDGVERVKKS